MKDEKQTRKEIIDKRLQKAGWNINDRSQVVEEFSVTTQNIVEEQPITYSNLQFSDYVLLGKDGNPAIVKTITKFAFQRHIAYIKPNKDLINSYFLFEALKSDFVKFQIEKVVKGVAQKTLNLSELKKIKIPIVNSDIQNKYVAFTDKIYSKKNQLRDSLTELTKLFNSILQRAFNGDLNFNIDAELDSLLNEIDLQKKENDLSKIVGDEVYLQRLIDKLNTQEFKEKDLYNKAKHGVFQLLKEGKKVTQAYNEQEKSIQLALI